MLKVRLARGGSKKNAHYKVVVIESTKSRDGKAVDIIGNYHPGVHTDEAQRFVIDAEKLNKWIAVGAQPTQTIVRLCLKNGAKVVEKFVAVHGESKNKGKTRKEIKAEATK